jgi:hypothetical protein
VDGANLCGQGHAMQVERDEWNVRMSMWMVRCVRMGTTENALEKALPIFFNLLAPLWKQLKKPEQI